MISDAWIIRALLLFTLVNVFFNFFPDSGDGRFNKIWHGLFNRVKESDVHISKRPFDCDFFYAPVGFKGCYYDEIIELTDHPRRLDIYYIKKFL